MVLYIILFVSFVWKCTNSLGAPGYVQKVGNIPSLISADFIDMKFH